MDEITRKRLEAQATILKAVAHSTRLYIVSELGLGRRCVSELTEAVGADASTVSKHLLVLKNAGMVTDEKVNTSVYYSLATPCVLNFLGCVDAVLRANAARHVELLIPEKQEV